ncbi:MAG: hypothetical protein HY520_02315 [Candidatus Aenigmarchaeota archaeon]|nr:hypothetical protein [Candidatus Aenigmarchaeota archaeon]
MQCASCGQAMEKGWQFCPSCGSGKARGFFDVGDIFSRMRRQMDQMRKEDDAQERDMEVLDLTPMLRRRQQATGFTIHISSGTGRQPRVDIQTFGDVDRRALQEQVQRQLGLRPVPLQGPPARGPAQREPRTPARAAKSLPVAKTTVEPRTEVRSEQGRVLVEMDLPHVKEQDIRVEELESSVEVKAVAGDTGYFKILTKPERTRLAGWVFKNGTLRLELV